MYVSEYEGYAGFRCGNKQCTSYFNLQMLQCFVEWRDRDNLEISRTLGDVMAMKADPVKGLVPDFSSEVFDPKLSRAPYRRCDGHLKFDQSTRHNDHPWLVCERCQTRYRTTVLADWDASGKTLYHQHYYYDDAGLIQKRTLVMPPRYDPVKPNITMLIDIVKSSNGEDMLNPYRRVLG
jgi:hypothetical protein